MPQTIGYPSLTGGRPPFSAFDDGNRTSIVFPIVFILLACVGLHLCGRYSYLLFHSLSEGFSIIVACGLFMLVWNSRHLLENDYLLFLGIAYLFVAGLDLAHTLSYSGMGVIPHATVNIATQLWISTRYLESISLLIAPFFLIRKLNRRLAFAGFGSVAVLLLAAIFSGHFPVCFVAGTGLTGFKIVSEFFICIILFASIVILHGHRRFLDRQVYRLVAASVLSAIAAEMAFTLYTDPYGLLNQVGHFLEIVSFYLIYRAVIVTGLRRPFDLFYRQMNQKRDRFELLARTTSELLHSAHPKDIVESLCGKVIEHLDCQVFINFLVDERAGRLHLNACSGISTDDARKIEWLDFGIAVCGCVAQEGRNIVAEHITTTSDEQTNLVKSFGIKAYACHPLLSKDRKVIGTLSFGTKTRETFSEEDLDLMRVVADLVAVAIRRMQTEEELRNNRDELAAANKELESFSYSVSHDLRNPLNNMLAVATVLGEGYADSLDENGKRCVVEIKKNVDKMKTIITQLLQLSKIAHHSLNISDVRLDAIAVDFLAELRTNAPQREVKVIVDENMTAHADESLMRIALENLIGNAWKYSSKSENPCIEIGTKNDSARRCFFVRDNGIGFDMKDAQRIFEPFQRAHREKEYEGTGIGLSIVKRIIEKHGGRIWTESEAGNGACFYFTLT